jgi:tRNA(fMet)-specific endonuclease VapC
VKYLLDTNTCIFAIKKDASCLRNIEAHRPEDIAISSITVAELEYGVAKSRRQAQNKDSLVRFLRYFELLDFDQMSAEHYGAIRACLEESGQPIGAMDMLIAAEARAYDLIVVTDNVREFERVPNLTVENWS